MAYGSSFITAWFYYACKAVKKKKKKEKTEKEEKHHPSLSSTQHQHLWGRSKSRTHAFFGDLARLHTSSSPHTSSDTCSNTKRRADVLSHHLIISLLSAACTKTRAACPESCTRKHRSYSGRHRAGSSEEAQEGRGGLSVCTRKEKKKKKKFIL